MKRNIFKRLTSLLLTGALVMSGIAAFSDNTAGGTAFAKADKLTLKASYLNADKKTNKGGYFDGNPDADSHLYIRKEYGYKEVEIVLDEDLHLDTSTVYGNLTLSGDHTLYLDIDKTGKTGGSDLFVNGDMTLKKGAGLVQNSYNGDIKICRYKNETHNFNSWGNITILNGTGINVNGDINIYDGNITSDENATQMPVNVFYSSIGNLNISGGNFSGISTSSYFYIIFGIKISGGTFDIKSIGKCCIQGYYVDISGGDIKCYSEHNVPLYVGSRDLTISGGNIDLR